MNDFTWYVKIVQITEKIQIFYLDFKLGKMNANMLKNTRNKHISKILENRYSKFVGFKI